jgi:hypothetical protein
MRQLKLRFLLLAGHFVDILLPEGVARKYVQDWGRGELKGTLYGVDDDGTSWAVDTKNVQAMHTYDPVAMQQRQEQLLQQQMAAQQAIAQGAMGGNKAWGGKTGSG